MAKWNGVAYQAMIHIPRIEGFWMPHEESEIICSGPKDSMAEAMDWLANQPESYENVSYLDLWVDGHVLVSWQFGDESPTPRVTIFTPHGWCRDDRSYQC